MTVLDHHTELPFLIEACSPGATLLRGAESCTVAFPCYRIIQCGSSS